MTDNIQADKDRIIRDLQSLQQDISETALARDITNFTNELQNLPMRLQTIRQQGYVFAADVDQALQQVIAQWQSVQGQIQMQIQQVHQSLNWNVQNMQTDIMNKLIGADPATIQSYVQQVDNECSRLRSQLSQAKNSIMQVAGNVPEQVRMITDRITHIERYQKHMLEASFRLNSGESLFMAVDAEWKKGKDNKENPDGVFFVTNQRLIMEENEKKGGFLGVGGNKVQGLLWDIPLSNVQGVSAENKGLLGNVDLVHIRTGNGTPAPEVIVEVKDVKADWFTTELQRVVSGGLDRERISQ